MHSYNDLLAINHTGLQIRSASTVNINGLYFSFVSSLCIRCSTHSLSINGRNRTFFGGQFHL